MLASISDYKLDGEVLSLHLLELGKSIPVIVRYDVSARAELRQVFTDMGLPAKLSLLRDHVFDWDMESPVCLPQFHGGTLEKAKPIAVDIHESLALTNALNALRPDVAYSEHLVFGDVMFSTFTGRWVGIELKRDDLFPSIQSGLLSQELTKLIDLADIPILAIPSLEYLAVRARRAKESAEIDLNYYRNALRTWSHAGVHIEVTGTTRHDRLAEWLLRLYDYYQDSDHKSLDAHPRLLTPAHDRHYGKDMLLAIDEWGEETADVALQHFGSARRVLMATNEERQAVKGIGKRRANAVDLAMDQMYVPREKQPL